MGHFFADRLFSTQLDNQVVSNLQSGDPQGLLLEVELMLHAIFGDMGILRKGCLGGGVIP